MIKKVILIIAIILIAGSVIAGEKKMTPKKEQAEMQQAMQMMGPMMGSMMESMFDTAFKVMAKPENADRLATFTKNYYDALISKGFSKEEALRIVVNMGMPSMSGMK
jgi:archaellum component FlaG (FlaF/FlaG flagellin family)